MSNRVVADAPLSEQERIAIGTARDLLKKYGQYVDVAEMSDVAYEQRNCRMKALDLATQRDFGRNSDQSVKIAQKFYEYLWEGKVPDGDV